MFERHVYMLDKLTIVCLKAAILWRPFYSAATGIFFVGISVAVRGLIIFYYPMDPYFQKLLLFPTFYSFAYKVRKFIYSWSQTIERPNQSGGEEQTP